MDYTTRIDILESKVDRLLSLIEKQQPIQQRLDRHITFIESVYARLKGAVSYLSWFGGQKPLPEPLPEPLPQLQSESISVEETV